MPPKARSQDAPILAPKAPSHLFTVRSGASPSTSWIVPLWKLDDQAVQEWYDTNNWIAPLNQVRFLYGFGQDTKSLSADLATMVFSRGFFVGLGTSVTSSSGNDSSGTGDTKDSPSQAIEKLKAGGDFYVRGLYPLIASPRDNAKYFVTVMLAPRLGFNFSGFGSEATITEATEYNANVSLEAYAQRAAIGDTGFVYADVRSGWQGVRSEFAQKIGLGGKNNFLLSQFDAGIQFSGVLRIGFQRFFGPAQAFNVSKNEFSKWHLVLQLAPLKKKK
jgi:hypothetical protein